ncbi:efflux RND transporter permease subunit [Aliikangiella maris]|uniref:Efflux RND transporter permease subunit n=2 Tax=Aliikangiella maris TaxID=3162458 RepID=A0ABV2BZ01_9GAMM
MLVAIFVVPVALAKVSQQETAEAKQIQLSDKWLKFVDIFIKNQKTARVYVAIFVITIMGATYWLMPAAEYLPEGEEPKAFSMMIAPPSYNLSEMKKIGIELREYFDSHVNAPEADFINGKTHMPPLAYYSMRVSVGRIWFLSAPVDPENIQIMMDAITQKFKSYEGMRAFSSRGSIISSNDGSTRAIAVDIAGPHIIELYAAAEAVYQAAERTFANPQINSAPGSLSLNQPMIEISPRWDRIAELGLSACDLSYSIAALSDGAYVDEFILEDDKVDIFLFSHAGNQQSIEQLANAPIITPTGKVMPLNALTDLTISQSSNSIRRVDSNRTVTVYIIPPRNVALETAEQLVRTQMLPQLWQQGKIAQGIIVSISGAADQLESTKASLSSNFLISIVLSYLLLVAIFTHWRYPLFILATVPLGMAGGLLGLIAVNGTGSLLNTLGMNGIHQPFDMITMLGFLILLGTVVNNPILIVDETRKYLQQSNAHVIEAVRYAVKKRLMPILMSTATTIFGLAPLVFIPGEGAELYRGVGIIVLTGILFSTLLTLSFLPALLVSIMKQKN